MCSMLDRKVKSYANTMQKYIYFLYPLLQYAFPLIEK